MDKTETASCRKCQSIFIPKTWQIVTSDFICKSCRNALIRNRIANDPKFKEKRKIYNAKPAVKESRSLYWKRYNSIPSNVIKRKARKLLRYRLEIGQIERKPCEVCGNIKTDGHHADYNKPLEVKWLCRRCHYAEERKITAMILEGNK